MAAGASSSPYCCVINGSTAARLRPTIATASANCSPVQQLEPSTSVSRCVNQPMLRPTSLSEIPTITTRPAEETISTAARTAAGSPVASDATTGPMSPAHARACEARASERSSGPDVPGPRARGREEIVGELERLGAGQPALLEAAGEPVDQQRAAAALAHD